MKKSALALAIATALSVSAAAQADTTLYGSARPSVDYTDAHSPKGSGDPNPPANWDVVNNTSRLGVLGSEDLGGGLSAIYQFEFGVDMTEGGNFEGNRPKYVGLKGGFGTFSMGTQYTPYYNVVGINDIFVSSKSFDVDAYLYPTATPRQANSIYYITPDFYGFTGEGMAVMNGQNTQPNSSGLVNWNLAAKYKNGPLFAGVTYAYFEGGNGIDSTDLFGLGVGYTFGPFNVNFTYENGNTDAVYGDAANYFLTGVYTFGDNSIQAGYSYVDPDNDKSVNNYLLGFYHHFSKRTFVYVEYIGRNDPRNVNTSDGTPLGNRNVVSIGMQHDF